MSDFTCPSEIRCFYPIHNVESMSVVSLCLHFLQTECHAGHVIIRGAYHDINILAQLLFLCGAIQVKVLILGNLLLRVQ